MLMDQATQGDHEREVEGSLLQHAMRDGNGRERRDPNPTWAPCRSDGPQSQLPT